MSIDIDKIFYINKSNFIEIDNKCFFVIDGILFPNFSHCHFSTSINRRILNALISFALYKDSDSITHNIKLTKLKKILDINGNNNDYLFESIEHLKDYTKIVYTERECNNFETLITNLKFESNVITFSLSEKIKRFASNFSIYSPSEILIQSKLTGREIILYELCNIFSSNSKLPEIKKNTFVKLMEFSGESKYFEFKVFNRDVLKSAIKKINLYTNLEINSSFTRIGRNIESIKIFITKKNYTPEAIIDKSSRRDYTIYDNKINNNYEAKHELDISQAQLNTIDNKYFEIYKSAFSKFGTFSKGSHDNSTDVLTPHIMLMRFAAQYDNMVPAFAEQERIKLKKIARQKLLMSKSKLNPQNICTNYAIDVTNDLALKRRFEAFLQDELEMLFNIYQKKGFASKAVLIALGIYLESNDCKLTS